MMNVPVNEQISQPANNGTYFTTNMLLPVVNFYRWFESNLERSFFSVTKN